MIRIFVDSSSDYTRDDLVAQGLELFPILITMGDTSYEDGINLQRNGLYEMMASTSLFPTTSQPTPQLFLDAFEAAKEQDDELIYLALSSALSGTYQSACLAKSMVDYDGIYVIDTLSATYNIKLLGDCAVKLRSEGYSAQEIATEMERLKTRVKVIAIPDTLEYLCRGGRLSRASATVGTLANIKPIITVTPKGNIGVPSKCIGMGKALSYVIKYLKDHPADPSFPLYTIYSYGTENCEKLEEKLTKANIAFSDRLQIGPTIGAHIGPRALGLVYIQAS